MAFKRRELARKDRKEDLRKNPGKYRDEHRSDLLGADRSSRRFNFLTQPLFAVIGSVLTSSVIVAIGFLKPWHFEEFHALLPKLGFSVIATFVTSLAFSAIFELRRRGFSKAFERLLRELPTSHAAPRLAQPFFLFVPKRNREHIIGDLEEEYRTSNKRFPRLWYWGQVFALVASYWWATLRRRLGFDVVLKMIRK